MTLAQRVATRYLFGAVLTPKWLKSQEASLRAVLKLSTDREDPGDWGYLLQEKLVSWFDRFQKNFEELVSLDQARISIAQRVESAKDYITAVAKKLPSRLAYFDFEDPRGFLRWYAKSKVEDRMKASVKTLGDILKYEWVLDENAIDRLVSKTMRSGTAQEIASLGQDGTQKYYFLERVGFEAAAARCVKKSKLDWDPLKWLSRTMQVLEANYSEEAVQEGGLREFDLHGMKVIVNDSNLMSDEIKKYIGYLNEAYAKMRAKGFASAWYGNVYIECKDCGGVNPNTGGGTGGWYEWGRDTVTIFQRPGPFVVELMVHELGHRYWFKQMSSGQRARFEALVKTHTVQRPSSARGVRPYLDSDLRQPKAEVETIARKFQQLLAGVDLGKAPAIRMEGRGLTRDILDVVSIPEFEEPIRRRWKDPVYNLSRDVMEHFEDITMLSPGQEAEWTATARSLVDQYLNLARRYLNEGLTEHNRLVREKLDLSGQAWLDSLTNNPAPVPAVSDYGESNVDEAFAEVFAHYVLEYDITRDQVDSFKAVVFQKTAVENEAWRRDPTWHDMARSLGDES